jgi:uncharacterized repeat protein (TIGR01451 family)
VVSFTNSNLPYPKMKKSTFIIALALLTTSAVSAEAAGDQKSPTPTATPTKTQTTKGGVTPTPTITKSTPTPTTTQATKGDTTCQPAYGYGQTCVQVRKVELDKKVKHPTTGEYVDTLTVNDPRFKPLNTIEYKVTVTNTGKETLTNLVLTDYYPDHITFTKASVPFTQNGNVLTYTIDSLTPGASKEFTLTGIAASADKLPADKGVVCVINRAQVKVQDQTGEDTAQACIQKDVLGKVYPPVKVEKTPPTGPETLALVGLLPTGLAGLLLRKRV